MPTLRKRGSIYYVYWYEGGKQHSKAVSPDKAVAQEFAHRVEGDMYRQKAGLSRPSARWLDFCTKYLEYSKTNKCLRSSSKDRTIFKTFNRLCPLRTVSEYTAPILEEYKQKRKEQGMHTNSINREMNTLKNAGNKLEEWGYLPNNPVRRVSRFPMIHNKIRYLSKEEIARIFAMKGNHNVKLALQIGLYTGARASEVLSLQFKNIDLIKREIMIENKEGFTVKEKKSKVVPINDKLYTILRALKGKPEDYLITLSSGDVLSTLIKRAYVKLHIKDATFHTLRHTFISHLLMPKDKKTPGTSPFVVAKIVGHSNLEQLYETYGHLIEGEAHKAINTLPY